MTVAVERWIPFSEASDAREIPGWSGFGGWFGFGDARHHRWPDYLETLGDEAHPYVEAVRRDVIAKRIRRGGSWHQNDPEGMPLFTDGLMMPCSWRAWGDFLAAVWSTEEDKDYCYLDFYWTREDEE